MPWKESTVMSEREEFIARVMSGEKSMSAICQDYGISRKTGYKWVERIRSGESLDDRSRAPLNIGNRTAPDIEELILSCREEHPTWGPRKLLRYLQNRGYQELPCKSTVGNILKRHNLISAEESEKHTPWQRFERNKPNELWQMDFKGDFAMLNGQRCYPLDITDDHSRYALCLEARENYKYEGFQAVLSGVLQEYGLPDAILCDNGKPWGESKGGITVFDVWMMQMDILPIHGRPLHPQTQGKLERFHRTLKTELLERRPMQDLQDAQKAFDAWRWCYNNERPHEALALDCPSKHYKPSRRKFPSKINEPEYDNGAVIRKVNYKGYISVYKHRYYLTEALAGKYISLRETDSEVILSYSHFDIAKIDLADSRLSLTGVRNNK